MLIHVCLFEIILKDSFYCYPVGVIDFYVSYFFLPPGAILSNLIYIRQIVRWMSISGSCGLSVTLGYTMCQFMSCVRLMSHLCQFHVGPSSFLLFEVRRKQNAKSL